VRGAEAEAACGAAVDAARRADAEAGWGAE
jgi:hypothetical protein